MKNSTVFAAILSILGSASLLANTVNLTGDTTGAPTFNRPTESGGARSFQTVNYQAYKVNINTSGPYTFALNAVDPSTYDTFLHLFVGAFDPTDTSDPAANFVAANDDANASTTNSSLTQTLNSANTYFFVADGALENLDAGPYTASISGPGTVTAAAVPEPSSTILIGLAGTALLLIGLKRNRARR